MREANVSLRTYHEALRQLESRGLVVRMLNAAPDERIPKDRRPNLFVLNLGGGVAETATASSDGVAETASRGSRNRRDGVADIATQTVIEPSVEPTHARESFDEFWTVYPRKVGKPTARAAYGRALKRGVSSVTIIGGARWWKRRWKKDATEERFMPHPSTWLNRDGWNDVAVLSVDVIGSSTRKACGSCNVYTLGLLECPSARNDCPVTFSTTLGKSVSGHPANGAN